MALDRRGPLLLAVAGHDPSYRFEDGRGSFGGHGRIAGGRVGLEDPRDVALRELERGLQERVLALIGGGKDQGGPDSELAMGRPLA